MNTDRFGNERCDSYRKNDFSLCEQCVPDGEPEKAKLDTACRICGGYGEYPKPSPPNAVLTGAGPDAKP